MGDLVGFSFRNDAHAVEDSRRSSHSVFVRILKCSGYGSVLCRGHVRHVCPANPDRRLREGRDEGPRKNGSCRLVIEDDVGQSCFFAMFQGKGTAPHVVLHEFWLACVLLSD